MDEILYRALVTYFNTLTKVGYKSYDVVYKLIVIDFIHDIINTEWRFYVTKKDSILMQDLLYQFLGSTCEFSFPTNCICCCKNEGSVPVEPVYMYTGTSEPAEIPTEDVILEADKYNYNSAKTFNTPKWVSIDVYKNTIIWIVLPNSVSLVSVENNSFPGDFIHGGPNEMQMQTSPVTIDNKEYTIYYRINPIATNVSYKVTVQ